MFYKVQVMVNQCICEKCKHEWKTLNEGLPKVCPKCKNFRWNIEGALKERQEIKETNQINVINVMKEKSIPEYFKKEIEEIVAEKEIEDDFDFGA